MSQVYNITYEKQNYKTIYKQVGEHELIANCLKEGFKAFVFKHKPTRIAMVKMINGSPVIGDYNE